MNAFCLCCTGWNSTITAVGSTSCPEGMTQCLFEEVVTLDYMVYFNFFGCILVPLLLMLIIYVNIFMAARRQLRLMSVKVAHTPAPGQKAPSSSSSRSVLQKEVHAAKSLAIIVGLFALCWLPLHIINCFNHLCEGCERPHIWVINIAIILSHANSVVNPFIYAYRIREFRQTFRKIFYQHILRWREALGAGNADSRGVGSDGVRRISQTSKEGSTCGMTVNSFILDPYPDQTRHGASREPSSCWTSSLDVSSSSCVPNGRHETSGSVAFSAQDASKSVVCLQEAADVLELRDRGSCAAFANVRALPPNQMDGTCSAKITEVS